MMNWPSPGVIGTGVRITGLVQGVGFRPYVWRLAGEFGLSGFVLNDGQGVKIEAWGNKDSLDAFIAAIGRDAPPLARIDRIEAEVLTGKSLSGPFQIGESRQGTIATGVVPDAATCAACREEIYDPTNRRYGYPFTNCTHCGPRHSIVRSIPYDRARTSMAAFAMCPDCQTEYDSPADRRFHAQPNACPSCGPQLWLENSTGRIECNESLTRTAELIRDGFIVAIKGIGGFHLACDATNEMVVTELRLRKRRPHKPFALLAREIEMVRRYAKASETEVDLLRTPAAPIVLLDGNGEDLLASSIAPGQDRFGFMLPYTPLHDLLIAKIDAPIVLTSGNLTDEPQVIDNANAIARLSSIADYWLMHDRDIVNRVDDSVVRVGAAGPVPLRRARGLAPEPLLLDEGFQDGPNVLAMGGELKSTFCLLQNGQAIVSQHIGDLEDAAVNADYRKSLDFFLNSYEFTPAVVALDKHPDYLSTQLGEQLARKTGCKAIHVQHHHAHMSACLADNHIAPDDDQSVGIVLDGLGLGDDGTIWGGEILLGGYREFSREGHFLPVAMPGGPLASREPWRNAVAHLHAAFGQDYEGMIAGTALGEVLSEKRLSIVHQAIERAINAPLASSAGRLFDAAAAMLGICCRLQSYEGQAAMQLETLARPHVHREAAYDAQVSDAECHVLSWQPLWQALLSDLRSGVEIGRIAARFHLAVVRTTADAALSVASCHGVDRVALSGGVMQNEILMQKLSNRLSKKGIQVLTHRRVPANDGGLCLGQAITGSICSFS